SAARLTRQCLVSTFRRFGVSTFHFLYFCSPPTSQLSTIAMITASHGRSRVASVCRAELPLANSTISCSPAPTASTATSGAPVSLPSPSSGRSNRNFRPTMDCSLRVETTVPITFASNMSAALGVGDDDSANSRKRTTAFRRLLRRRLFHLGLALIGPPQRQ